MAVIHEWADSAHGLDGAAPADAKHINHRLARWIAKLLNLVHRTGRWSRSSYAARLAPVLKPGGDAGKPPGPPSVFIR